METLARLDRVEYDLRRVFVATLAEIASAKRHVRDETIRMSGSAA